MIWLRSALFNAWFVGVTVLFCLASPLARWRAARSAGRHAIIAYARAWARTVLAGLRAFTGIGWQVTGLERVPRGAALIAAQHQSVFETLLWTTLLPDFSFVLKRELLRIPVFGGLLRAAGMIAIDRAAGVSSIRILLRRGAEAVGEGRQLVIFPEGTRVAPGATVPLQSGVAALAAHVHMPIFPVVTDSGRLWARGAFRKRPGTIRVEVLAAIPAGTSRPELMGRLATCFAAGPATGTASGRPVDKLVDVAAGNLARQSKPSR